LTLSGVRLATGATVDVVVRDGVIDAVEGHSGARGGLELSGYLLLPAPVEPHTHLEKALTAQLTTPAAGDLSTAVASWQSYREHAEPGEVLERARRAALQMVDRGVTAIRTHVDVGERTGATFVKVMVELRAELVDVVTLQIVAMVNTPVCGSSEAVGNVAALRDALVTGADLVGGAPYRDPDPDAAVALLLDVARDHAVPLDLHIDETLDSSVLTLARLPAQLAAAEMTAAVTASHCVSLGVQPEEVVAEVAADLATASVSVVTCPATNLYLQGRSHPTPVPRGLTAISALHAAGVVVAAGGDNIQDAFNPLGGGDPLVTAALLVWGAHLSPERAYQAVSADARIAMGLPAVQLLPGDPADLLAIRASDIRGALADPQTDRVVIRGGRVVSRTAVATDRCPVRPA
jgi:cytosine deaminase